MLRFTAMPSRLFALFCIGILAGCGWHLRGLEPQKDAPPEELEIEINIPALRVDSESVDYRFSEAFSDYAIDSGVDITSESTRVPRFILHTTELEREVATLNERGYATSFVLHYDVTYELRAAFGSVLIARETLSASRELEIDTLVDEAELDPNIDYLEQDPTLIEEESEILNTAMERELIRKILLKIQARFDKARGESPEESEASEEAEASEESEEAEESEEPEESEAGASDEAEAEA